MKKIALMMMVVLCGFATTSVFAADNSMRLIDPPVKHHKVVHKKHHAKKHQVNPSATKKLVQPVTK